jgi:hypothetical protein
MSVLDSVEVGVMTDRGSIRDTDVHFLDEALDRTGCFSSDEAAALIDINRACRVQSPAWMNFFVYALTDHVVQHLEPAGYVNSAKAVWFASLIARDGRVETRAELELLVSVIERARWVPASLVAFALAQVREAVICGSGPTRTAGATARGLISAEEIDLVRSLLCSFSKDDRIAVTRAEAEILFDINDEIRDGQVPPGWTDLFVKAINSAVMAAGGYAVPHREAALRPAERAANGARLPTGSLNASVQAALESVRDSYCAQSSEERSLARLERQRIEIVTNETIFESDVSWLAVRLLGECSLTPVEEALVSYLRQKDLIDGPLLGMDDRHSGAAA